jgi:hypothetical protein
MINYFKFLYQRLRCCFKGHSHPMFNCFHCGARSPLEFIRDENGNVPVDDKGIGLMKWRGWGWKQNGR